MFGRRQRDELQAKLDTATAELERRTSSPLEAAVGQGVVLHCADRRSVSGILTGIHDAEVTLEAGRILQEGAGAFQMDGTIAVPRRQIVWYQLGVTIDDGRLTA